MSEQLPTGYTVQNIHGCRVVFGPIPVMDFCALAAGFSDHAICSIEIASRIGASFVIGEPDDIAALGKADLSISAQRQLEAAAADERGLGYVADWLKNGERGLSSNAMCKHLFGVPDTAGVEHPRDPDDLRRCFAFVEANGAQDMVSKMGAVSPEWAALVAIWDELEQSLRGELLAGKTAPLTYARMRTALGA